MSRRTTIVLDESSEEALDALTRHYGCSASEAIRRALMKQRERVVGVPEEKRKRRVAAMKALIELMDGHDWEAELAELERADEYS